MQQNVMCVAALFASLVAVAHSTAKNSLWRPADFQCAPQNASSCLAQFDVNSETHCAIMADQKFPTGALVAQFDRLSRACSVFDFQSVCRSLTAGRSPSCAVFFRFPINHRSISPKLNNVWLADDVSRLENVVCQADRDTNRLHPVGVEWSSEGAVFDGTSAYAVLNKSSINFATGLTWLLRIKRQPQVQPFYEFANCSALTSPTNNGIVMWEFNLPGRLFARSHEITSTPVPYVFSPFNAMPQNPDEWQNIGFTSSGGSFEMFLNESFINNSSLESVLDLGDCTVDNSNICLYFGMRVGTLEKFNGTVRALALASSRMTEAEIREFFNLIL